MSRIKRESVWDGYTEGTDHWAPPQQSHKRVKTEPGLEENEPLIPIKEEEEEDVLVKNEQRDSWIPAERYGRRDEIVELGEAQAPRCLDLERRSFPEHRYRYTTFRHTAASHRLELVPDDTMFSTYHEMPHSVGEEVNYLKIDDARVDVEGLRRTLDRLRNSGYLYYTGCAYCMRSLHRVRAPDDHNVRCRYYQEPCSDDEKSDEDGEDANENTPKTAHQREIKLASFCKLVVPFFYTARHGEQRTVPVMLFSPLVETILGLDELRISVERFWLRYRRSWEYFEWLDWRLYKSKTSIWVNAFGLNKDFQECVPLDSLQLTMLQLDREYRVPYSEEYGVSYY